MKSRWNTANVIIIRCWEYIKDFLDKCAEKSEENSTLGSGIPADEILSQILSSLAGTSAEGTGNTVPIAESGSCTENTAPGKSQRQATAIAAASVEPPDSASDESDDTGNKSGSDDTAENGEGDSETNDKSGFDESEEPNSVNTALSGMPPMQEVSSEEKGRIPLEQTDGVYNPSGGETETDGEYQGSGYPNAAADIERLLDNMAERAANTQLENERTSELNELAQSISYGNIHEGVNKTVHRITEVSDELKEMYKIISPPLLYISKQLQRSVKQHIKDRRTGGRQNNLLMGRRLDSHSLHRKDGRVFCKDALPSDIPEMCVGLLLDESGSMAGADRATYARAAAVILYDFCTSLGIPIMIYGHSTGMNSVDLYSYAEFEAIDSDDCYRLMDISARSSNRDGAALRYAAERLAKRHEDIKMLMLISDGQPADTGYGGTAAEEDLRGIKFEYTRKGILFIAAAVGSDKENIERIYGDSYMDITDLSTMPVMLAKIVKRHIRV